MITGKSLRLAGYAGLFDVPDADKDMIRRGAFSATLSGRTEPLPLLWEHRSQQKIGEIEYIAEDDRGLRIIARMDRMDTRAASMLNQGAVSGLSFGYRAKQFNRREVGRELLAIDLFEVSLVTRPLQHGARVHLIS